MDSPMVWDEHSQNTIIISEVKKYEHLYDLRRPDYKDASKKERSWAAIAAVINADPSAVKKRWKNLRDTYARKMKEAKRLRRIGAIPTRQERWPYFGMLGFLQDVVKTRVTYCSVMNKSQTFEGDHTFKCESEEISDSVVDELNVTSIPSNSSCTFDSGVGENQERIETSVLHPISFPTLDSVSSKTETYVCSTPEQTVQSSVMTSHDAAESFGRYVAAEMRDLPRHQQQWARFKISEVLYQASGIQPSGSQVSNVRPQLRQCPEGAFVLKQSSD